MRESPLFSPSNWRTVYARVSVGHGRIQECVSQWEADVPAPTPGHDACIDDPEGWFDIDGPDFNCLWYASDFGPCSLIGDSLASGGLTANEVYCACARVDSPNAIDGKGVSGDGSFNITFGSYVATADVVRRIGGRILTPRGGFVQGGNSSRGRRKFGPRPRPLPLRPRGRDCRGKVQRQDQ